MRFFAGQLTLELRWTIMGDEHLSTVIEAVMTRWNAEVTRGAMSDQTLTKFGSLLSRFERFATAHDVHLVSDLTPAVVEDFVVARGRNRSGEVADVALATMHNRRATLGVFFRAARTVGIVCDDHTRDVVLPEREPGNKRPLTADEAEMVRFFADRGPQRRHAASVALLLCGARTAELGHIEIGDIDLEARTASLPGSRRHRERLIPLDENARDVLAERIAFLKRQHRTDLCEAGIGSDAARQARIGMTITNVLHAAGLGDDPDITPTSLTAYAGARIFAETGRIEDVAHLTGMQSLDAAATLINYHWQPVHR